MAPIAHSIFHCSELAYDDQTVLWFPDPSSKRQIEHEWEKALVNNSTLAQTRIYIPADSVDEDAMSANQSLNSTNLQKIINLKFNMKFYVWEPWEPW